MSPIPAYPPGATGTRRSATGAASMRAMRTATASARCTSTPLRASGRYCAPGCARTAASRKTSCRSISASSSSCTTHADAAKPCSEPSSPPSHDQTQTAPPRNPIRASQKSANDWRGHGLFEKSVHPVVKCVERQEPPRRHHCFVLHRLCPGHDSAAQFRIGADEFDRLVLAAEGRCDILRGYLPVQFDDVGERLQTKLRIFGYRQHHSSPPPCSLIIPPRKPTERPTGWKRRR